jgi:hypothetical protein
VICRNCGTEIADKAIVCYRCGTGTTEPLRKPVEIRRRRSPVLVLTVFVIALLIALYLAWNGGMFALELTIVEEARISSVLIDFVAGNA